MWLFISLLPLIIYLLFKKKRVKRIIKPSYEEDIYVFHALLASGRRLQGGREQEVY